MTTPTPPIEVMASIIDNPYAGSAEQRAAACLSVLARDGWVLIPRTELEEAADWLTRAGDTSDRPGHCARFTKLAAALRQRSRG